MQNSEDYKISLCKELKEILLSKYKNLQTDKKRIITNFFSLSTLEIVNYIIPLLTLPYLVKVLGPGKYGIVAFAQVFAGYFVIAADYGFYLSAPRKIAINRDDISLVSKIYSRIMTIKFFFMLLSIGIFFLLILSIGRFADDKLVFLFSMTNILGDFLFPAWFFQGIERMKLITYFYFIAKSFFLITIFLFIKTPAEYQYVPLFNNLGLIIAGFISLYVIHKNFKIKFYLSTFKEIKDEIIEAFNYFISTVSINAYTNSGTFILGLFADNIFVGYYSAAERLIRAIQRILWAASQSVYPYINRLVSQS
ncbi:MAG: oligosaccharide flippase family protein, partial [bacterium]